ncbi:type II toxin-antitoxin system VapC family toxin [Paraburkholderia fungorum]|jgi:toxin FitB|uniref:type II toxin-antitoxin system VapC family toxin n=1 Tax=Paraburkholderia fungorum TaxID=134537 RepID=UPI000DAFAA1D|nr:type II toxin-antitoxin system VapC family toxin [Paraburkholderia fungorum]PZR45668.1 MAG: VapC toxin family PIN domain ribonuclease [Paraburkholderia fungorum]
MIVLDTNVLSETLRPLPDAKVMAWLAAQPRGALFTTTVTRAEIRYGLHLLPDGSRKSVLSAAIDAIFTEDFSGRLLSFDSDAAEEYARIAMSRRNDGRPISQFDAMIAATARSRGAALATRNVKDFTGCNIAVIDPWALS